MEVWNGIWKKILVWNGRFLVWNGRKLPVLNMEKSSSIPYHALVAAPASSSGDVETSMEVSGGSRKFWWGGI